MPKTLHLPQVRLEERVSKFRPTCSFRSMPKTTSIDKMVFSEVGDMGLIFQMTKFQPKRKPITHYIVQYVHTAQMVPWQQTHSVLQGYFGPLEVRSSSWFLMKLVDTCLSFPKTPRSPQLDHRVPSYGLTKEERSKCIKIRKLFNICIKAQWSPTTLNSSKILILGTINI